ncbi:sigma-54-dependent transcriptional regulator [Flocculibacter collagenilyticus]|uniref:sigma-54-dependent transcriptional regulator n=1 Tax=Flocculibacter collagenilyticus TaxID=2744479 RepID=UPI0018F5E907|nr:sigma-54 dependent transcriptional regulator [Flocculibacter collagenilyticus]
MTHTILIADDDINIIASLKFLLEDDFTVVATTTPSATKAALQQQTIDLVLMDMNFQRDTTSGEEGLTLIGELLAQHQAHTDSRLPIIVMTGWATIDIAVNALKAGASDFVQKPWNDEHLVHAIKTQLHMIETEHQVARLSQHNKQLNAQLSEQLTGLSNTATDPGSAIIAVSPVMQQLMQQLRQLAQSDMNILLTGENGTGKSLLAHYIHQASARQTQPFIAVNMGAIPDTLFESEMFGHKKGAFTDAKENRIGRFEMADHGTLFFDELANIPLPQQATLLRVLEEKSFEPVGSNQTLHSDVRVISATNANLDQAIKDSLFRQDLYYRLNTIELRVPALRERQTDIIPLAQQFLQQHCHKYRKANIVLTESAKHTLTHYAWPGNVRELNHTMERAVFSAVNNKIEASQLSLTAAPTHETTSTHASPNDILLTLNEIEQQSMIQRLEHFNGNVSQTAKSLGLSRSGYYRRLSKFTEPS